MRGKTEPEEAKLAHTFVLYVTPRLRELGADHELYDLHVHSSYSDGHATPQQLVQWAAQHGLGLAVTDHNEIRGSIRALELQKCKVVPGIEIASKQRYDVLAYFEDPADLELFYKECVEGRTGPNPWSYTDLDVYDLLRMCRERGALTVLPHPFWYGWKNWTAELEKNELRVAAAVDGIECCNASLPKYLNQRALRLADRIGKAYVGGSDAHHLLSVGSVVTLVARATGLSVTEAMRRRMTSVIGNKTPFYRSLTEISVMTAYHAQFWPRMINSKIKEVFRGRVSG